MEKRDAGLMTISGPRRLFTVAATLCFTVVLLGCDRPPPGAAAKSDLPEPASVESAASVAPTLQDLVGPEWLLTHLDREEPVPAEPEITLVFEGEQIAGVSGCNRYFAGVESGATPGSLTVGVIGATRMACPQEIMALEQRYLEALEGVTRFGFFTGKLILSSDGEGEPEQLVYVPREPASSPPAH